jgi:DNA-binding MarR family transcriptional regulator
MSRVAKSRPGPGPGRLTKADFEEISRLRYQLRKFLRFSEDLCRANGLTPLQYQFLIQVIGSEGRDWSTISEIAEKLQAKHHGVVALVDRCEKLDFVERRQGSADRRQVEIHLRPKGLEIVHRLAGLHRSELGLLKRIFREDAPRRESAGQPRKKAPGSSG